MLVFLAPPISAFGIKNHLPTLRGVAFLCLEDNTSETPKTILHFMLILALFLGRAPALRWYITKSAGTPVSDSCLEEGAPVYFGGLSEGNILPCRYCIQPPTLFVWAVMSSITMGQGSGCCFI